MMSSSAMEENITLPVNVDQLTCVVDAMVEVSSDVGSTAASLPNVNRLASSPALSAAANAMACCNAAADNQTVTDTRLPHTLQAQASGSSSSTNNVPCLHIPVSLTGHSISMLPLMLSLNLSHRPLISAVDKASIHTAPAPVPFPSVMAPVQNFNILSCDQATESCDNHQNHSNNNNNTNGTIETVESYPSAVTGYQSVEETSCDPNHVNKLISTSVQGTLQNPMLITSSPSSLSDIRLGMGITSQNDNSPKHPASMPDVGLSSLSQTANQFGQKPVEHQKSGAATASVAPCVMQQHNGSTLKLANGSAAEIAASVSGANLQSVLDALLLQQYQQLHSQPCNDEATNSFSSVGTLPNKSCEGNAAASATDINNMPVINMILKVHPSGAVAATTTPTATTATTATTTTEAATDETRSAVVVSGTSCQPGEDMATFSPKPDNQISFDNFCLECDYNNSNNNNNSSSSSSKAPCPIHNTKYCDIPDSPIPSRARLSIPSLLYLKTTSAHGYKDTLGVWAKETIPCRSRFGPFLAKVKEKCPVDSQRSPDFPTWMIFSDDAQAADVLDVSDENECNWMMFVKPARSSDEQNLVAYQQQHSIYFMTCCDVHPHQELLVWYSNDYASALGGVPLTADITLSCCVCRTTFASHKLLTQHLRSMHPGVSVRRWHCQICNKGFPSMTKLKTHLLTHIDAKPHSCSQCGKRFTDQSNLRMHQSIHTGVPLKADITLSCCLCRETFASYKLLTQHLRSMHPDVSVRRWHCQFCKRGFTSITKLKTHLLSHIGAKPHSCSQCGKRFTDQSNLRMHQSIHTGERKFPCTVCKKQFRQKAHLTSHMFTHTGEKKLQCQFCEKMFSRPSDLKQHEYQHTREKHYSCSHCDKSFYKIQNFKKHLKIHSGERNFVCVKCHKSFHRKYHLKRHSGTCKGSRNTAAVGDASVAVNGGESVGGVGGGGGGGELAAPPQSENCDLLHLDASDNVDDGRGGNDDDDDDDEEGRNNDEDDDKDDDVTNRNDEEEVEEEEDGDDDDNGGDEDRDEEEEEGEENDDDDGGDCETQQRTRV